MPGNTRSPAKPRQADLRRWADLQARAGTLSSPEQSPASPFTHAAPRGDPGQLQTRSCHPVHTLRLKQIPKPKPNQVRDVSRGNLTLSTHLSIFDQILDNSNPLVIQRLQSSDVVQQNPKEDSRAWIAPLAAHVIEQATAAQQREREDEEDEFLD